MAALEPRQIWWTPDEMAAARLPEMPGSKQGINLLADRLGWREVPGCAQRKSGRGGGWQYHWSVLPMAAQRKLLKDAVETIDEHHDRGTAWADYDGLPDSAKAKAADRLKALMIAESLHLAGATHVHAMSTAATMHKVSVRTLYNWLEMIEGVAPEDRLAYLAPRHRLGHKSAADSNDTRPFMDYLKSLYLRLEQPTFRQCHRIASKQAKAKGWDMLPVRTADRHLKAEVPRMTRVYARQGVTGLERCFPPQIRDRSGLNALEGVNADCHKIDVFVRWPDGKITRPQIVAFQDLYSGKILSWRVDHDPNKVMVMAAFGELVDTWGIPRHCLFDNGREFANKWLTAGTPTRFRFKVRDEDPIGVLPQLGIKVHWARPAHGQAKPIERAFRDLASDIAKDPRFEGAYVGNRVDAKPENYGNAAVPVETFLEVLAEGIAEHNARPGRLSHTAQGRSFDETFAESYAQAPIRKATEEQRRMWMMGHHAGQLNRQNGQLQIHGNFYYTDWMSQRAGEKVVARFDPENLHSGVYIYAGDGAFLGFAECRQKTGFFDVVGAKEDARRTRRIKRAHKELLAAHQPVSTEQISSDLNALTPPAPEALSAKVVAPEFGRKAPHMPLHRPQYERVEDAETDAVREAMIVELGASKTVQKADEPQDRFARAMDILARSEAGQAVGREEARWRATYIKTAEYQGLLLMQESFGQDGVG